jgi:DNA-binding CsgD family transcriptional regulator
VLLAAAVCTDNRVDTLLDIAGRDITDIITSKVGSHLNFVAAHFSFDDPRFRIWVHGTSSLSECTTVHGLLTEAYLRRGDETRSRWHQSLSALQGDATLVQPLLEDARMALHRGEVLRSVAIAREAASHAEGEPRADAHLIAGMAALGGGYVDDAVDWLEPLVAEGSERQRMKALPGYVTAVAMQRNVVPAFDATVLGVDLTDECQRVSWERTAALAAGLCAERSDGDGVNAWLPWLDELADNNEITDQVVRAAAAWCILLSGGNPPTHLVRSDATSENAFEAIAAGLDGRPNDGLAILAREGGGLSTAPDPLVQGFERTPLVRAYRHVVEALLQVWAGDFAEAKAVIDRAAYSTPFARGFAGLGIIVARRVELAITGETQALSAALAYSMPGSGSIDMLVDRAVAAYLADSPEEAADQIMVWTDRGAPHLCFGVPGLDEVGPFLTASAPESPDTTRGRNLRLRLRQVGDGSWSVAYENVRVESRTIVSPFERARVEAFLGELCIARNDQSGRRHLLVASMLFSQSGATAWQRLVERKLASRSPHVAIAEVQPVTTENVRTEDALGACRAAWSQILTERELQVAMLVVEGASNKEIAERLSVSVRTVEVHVGRVFVKLGVHNRVELVVRAHRIAQTS